MSVPGPASSTRKASRSYQFPTSISSFSRCWCCSSSTSGRNQPSLALMQRASPVFTSFFHGPLQHSQARGINEHHTSGSRAVGRYPLVPTCRRKSLGAERRCRGRPALAQRAHAHLQCDPNFMRRPSTLKLKVAARTRPPVHSSRRRSGLLSSRQPAVSPEQPAVDPHRDPLLSRGGAKSILLNWTPRSPATSFPTCSWQRRSSTTSARPASWPTGTVEVSDEGSVSATWRSMPAHRRRCETSRGAPPAAAELRALRSRPWGVRRSFSSPRPWPSTG